MFLLLLYSLFLGRVDSKGMVGKVSGVVGYPVTIPCDITPPGPGDSPHLILWYKNIFGTPIYSVDGRNGLKTATHWRDENVLGNRENFFISEEKDLIMAYLNISNTKPSDAGPYRCRVDFWKAATRNFKIFVELTTEVDALNIYNGKGKLITDRIVSSRINGSISLSCKSFGGSPQPVLSWILDNETVAAPVDIVQVENSVSSRLELRNLQIKDSGKTVTCLAKNNDLHSPPQASVKLEIVLAPVRVEISRTVSTFVAGTSYNLTCQVLGSNPTPTTFLWVAGKKLENINVRESSDGKIFTIVSTFIPTPEHDGEFISCRALNKYLPNEALEDQWKISVVYPPISVIRAEYPEYTNQSSLSVEVARKIILSCEAKSNPKPFEYHWRHKELGRINSQSSTSSKFILQDIKVEQAGFYTCLAENLQGVGESNSIYVDVQYPPICRDETVLEIFISVHESVDLVCEMNSNPGNLTFLWNLHIKDGDVVNPVDVPSSQYTQHERRSVLTLTPRTPGDFGTVTCRARNSVGVGRPCKYQINKKISVPGLKSCQVTTEWKTILVVCDPENQVYDEHIEYEAELLDTGLGISRTLLSSVPTFSFPAVRQNTVYTINVSVLQGLPSQGNGVEKKVKFSQVLSIKESKQESTSAPTDVSLLYEDQMIEKLLPLLGVSGLLIFTFIIVMVSISIIRRSRDIFKDKTVHTHIAFNQGLDQDIPGVHKIRSGVHRVHSMDQLNQITFEGFSSDALKTALLPKYNTLPIGGVSIVSVLQHANSVSDTSIVKRVTFAKGSGSTSSSNENSSSDSVRTMRDRSEYMNDQDPPSYQYEESSLI